MGNTHDSRPPGLFDLCGGIGIWPSGEVRADCFDIVRVIDPGWCFDRMIAMKIMARQTRGPMADAHKLLVARHDRVQARFEIAVAMPAEAAIDCNTLAAMLNMTRETTPGVERLRHDSEARLPKSKYGMAIIAAHVAVEAGLRVDRLIAEACAYLAQPQPEPNIGLDLLTHRPGSRTVALPASERLMARCHWSADNASCVVGGKSEARNQEGTNNKGHESTSPFARHGCPQPASL
jgi:hypothetical protein